MKRLAQILVIALLPLLGWTFAAHAENEYPLISTDLYLQMLYVQQENFRVENGIFGSSYAEAGGNFNSQLDQEAYRNLFESCFRLGTTLSFTDRIKGRFAIEINPRDAREQGFGDSSADLGVSRNSVLRLKNYYLEAEHSVGGFLGYRVGRQNFDTPRALVVGNADAEGLALWYRGAEVGQFLLAGAILDTRNTRELEDLYSHFIYEFPPSGGFTGSLYLSSLLYRDRTSGEYNLPPEISLGGGSDIGKWLIGVDPVDPSNASMSRGQLYWAGVELGYNDSGFVLGIDAVMNFGNLDPGFRSEANIDTVQSSMAMLDANYGRGFWRVGAAGAYVSGHDPDPSANRYTGFLDINANFGFTRFFFDGGPYMVAQGFASPAVQGSGLFGGKVYTEMTPLDWLSINLQVAGLSAQYDRPQLANDEDGAVYESVADNAGSYYGTEADFWLEFRPAKQLHWLTEVDYFQPGNYFKGTAVDKNNPTGFLESPDPAWRISGGFLFY